MTSRPTRRSAPSSPTGSGTGVPAVVAVSEELFAPVGPEVELCYQTFGDPDDEPLVLIMGLGGPMTWWDPQMCRMLAERGFYVIRFDNRDTGRSSRGHGRVRRTTLARAFAGRRVRAPYSLVDLVTDTTGLLDHLGLASAHVVGVSMGGMIAQTMAITQPGRVRSLTSIMSTTGKRSVGWQHPTLLPTLLASRGGREAYIESSAKVWRLIGSPGYPTPAEESRARAAETFDRGVSASGVLRQMLAILTQPNRGPRLHSVHVPALVVHGLADRMVHVSGGRATAAAIPGAELLLIDQMGHDLPPVLFDTYVDAIRRTADRAAPPA
ncbi:alpha/beta fold hydrolase [Nocardioides salsibiostraticola]